MRIVIQRVSEASVIIEGEIVGRIESGLLVLLGIERGDSQNDAKYLVQKLIDLRIFADADHGMNRSIKDVGGSFLIVSQFTLMGDCRKGRRPNFTQAAPPEEGKILYNYFVQLIEKSGIPVQTGVFGAMMKIHLINDGPVTLILESRRWKGERVPIV